MATATKTKTKSKVKLQPLGDRVVVQREESLTKTAGGIVLPDSAKEKPQRGTIIAVGDGRILDSGERSKLQVKAGDRVIFTSYAGDQFKVDEEEYLLMREDEILAVIED
jgi:chaperonin GroES